MPIARHATRRSGPCRNGYAVCGGEERQCCYGWARSVAQAGEAAAVAEGPPRGAPTDQMLRVDGAVVVVVAAADGVTAGMMRTVAGPGLAVAGTALWPSRRGSCYSGGRCACLADSTMIPTASLKSMWPLGAGEVRAIEAGRMACA